MTIVKKTLIGITPIALMIFVTDAAAKDQGQRYMLSGWQLSIKNDNFVTEVHCSLRSTSGLILYQPSAVGFRFSHEDTLHAMYRIDGGAPQRWQDRYPTLIAQGAQIDGAGLDSPTDGVVWLPVDQIIPARRVAIRLSAHSKVHYFALRGFAEMLAASRRLGCSTPASFMN